MRTCSQSTCDTEEEHVSLSIVITIVSLVFPEGPFRFSGESQISVRLESDASTISPIETKVAPLSKYTQLEEPHSVLTNWSSTLYFKLRCNSANTPLDEVLIGELVCTVKELISLSKLITEIPFQVFSNAAPPSLQCYLLLKAVQKDDSVLQVTTDRDNGDARQSCCKLLHDFALTLHRRFQESSDVILLDRALQQGMKALDLSDPSSSRRPILLIDLADMHLDRFLREGDMADLECASSYCNECQLLGISDRSLRPRLLLTMAHSLMTRFRYSADAQCLESCVQHTREALGICQLGHPDRGICLYTLARCLNDRYNYFGDGQDLESAMKHIYEAMDLCLTGHRRAACLTVFAYIVSSRSGMSTNMQELNRTVEYLDEVLDLRPRGHYLRPEALDKMGLTIWQKVNLSTSGNVDDLNLSIHYLNESLQLRSRNDPDRTTTLNSLGNAYDHRFREQGHASDLDGAILCHEESLRLRPPGHPRRFVTLNNLAVALHIRFRSSGDTIDLDRSIKHQIESLQLRPATHPYRNNSLMNLGHVLFWRYSAFGDSEDLEKATECYSEAAQLCPPGHPNRPKVFSNLADVHRIRYQNMGFAIEELDMAIDCCTEALPCCTEGSNMFSFLLWQLSECLLYRFHESGDPQDLNESLNKIYSVLDKLTSNIFGHAACRRTLADALLARYHMEHSAQDLELALEQLRTADPLLADGNPVRHSIFRSFAAVYGARYALYGDEKDQSQRFEMYQKAVDYATAGLPDRLSTGLQWISDAREQGHSSELAAFKSSLTLLDQYTMVTPAVTRRHQVGKVTVPSTLTADAAACAIEAGQLETAVELLEQGRALIWGQLARFRTSLDTLCALGETGRLLAATYKRLSVMLEQKNMATEYSEEDAQHYRTTWQEWKSVVKEIRQQKGFAHFLAPTPYSELAIAANEGPVIIVNIALYRCDALIIMKDRPLCLVPLQVTMDDVIQLSTEFQHALTSCQARGEEKSKAQNVVPVLRKLWRVIVHPIVRRLENVVHRGSRIWWCPTNRLVALPLHAAGPYKQEELNLPAIYVSSFTSTLSALIQSRQLTPDVSSRRLLAVGQAKPYNMDEQSELQTVDEELQVLKSLLPPTMSFDQLVAEKATREAVMHALHEHHWVHLACHGNQDIWNPYDSSFSMRDQPLRLIDIIQTRMAHPEFVFLSACHTAIGDAHTPDEVIHLAAALQFSGFRSVIGTIGAVDDGVVTHIVHEFYKNMFSAGSGHFGDAAKSLNKATRSLQKKGIPLDQRIVFIHIGA